MATKITSLRFNVEQVAQLDYLTQVMRKSQAGVVNQLIQDFWHQLDDQAWDPRDPKKQDPTLARNGGEIVTEAEQLAVKAIREKNVGKWI
ncbi:MAG: hypothetical protein ACYCOU_16400 [Sulfobacillus sp.]